MYLYILVNHHTYTNIHHHMQLQFFSLMIPQVRICMLKLKHSTTKKILNFKREYYFLHSIMVFYPHKGFPGSSAGEESICNAGDPGSIPGLGRSPGKGKGYPLQYSRLENSMDCIVHEVAKSWTRLSNFHLIN